MNKDVNSSKQQSDGVIDGMISSFKAPITYMLQSDGVIGHSPINIPVKFMPEQYTTGEQEESAPMGISQDVLLNIVVKLFMPMYQDQLKMGKKISDITGVFDPFKYVAPAALRQPILEIPVGEDYTESLAPDTEKALISAISAYEQEYLSQNPKAVATGVKLAANLIKVCWKDAVSKCLEAAGINAEQTLALSADEIFKKMWTINLISNPERANEYHTYNAAAHYVSRNLCSLFPVELAFIQEHDGTNLEDVLARLNELSSPPPNLPTVPPTISSLAFSTNAIGRVLVDPDNRHYPQLHKDGICNIQFKMRNNKYINISTELYAQQDGKPIDAAHEHGVDVLQPCDIPVFNVLITLMDEAFKQRLDPILPLTEFWRLVNGKDKQERPHKEQIEELKKQIFRAGGTVLNIDWKDYAKDIGVPYEKLEDFSLSRFKERPSLMGRMVDVKIESRNIGGQYRECVRIISTPPLYVFNCLTNYFERIPQNNIIMVQEKNKPKGRTRNLQHEPEIRHHLLLKLVSTAKEIHDKHKGDSTFITQTESLYEITSANDAKKRLNTRKTCSRILDDFKRKGYISKYNWEKKEQRITTLKVWVPAGAYARLKAENNENI